MEPAPPEEDKVNKKITHLLLNTPGACFLCLEDDDRDKDCLEDINRGIIDLSNICRYLNIDQCSLLLTSLKHDGGAGVEDLEQHSCTFSVNLCPKCLELTEKLNDMITQLEKAKLMVNFHLHSFHKILERKKEESVQWINLLERMTTQLDNSLEAKLVQLLREEAEDKSFKILKKAEAAMPQVIISKSPTPAPIPSSQSKKITKKSTPKRYPESSPSQLTESVNQLIKKLVESSLISTSTSDDDKNNLAKVIKRHRCLYCGISIVNSKIALHLTNQHTDKLLDPVTPSIDKRQDDNPSYFGQLCSRVLALELAKAARSKGGGGTLSSSVSSKLCCHLCASKYSDGRHLKHHFLVNHADHLCEQLIKMQKGGGGAQDKKKKMVVEKDKPLKIKRIRGRSQRNKNCLNCSQTFFKRDKLRRHMVSQHLNQLFLECKPGWMGDDQFKGICKEIFKREVGKATYGKPGDKIYRCGYCPPEGRTSYKGHEYLVVHLVYQHREEMEGKLKQDEEVEEGNVMVNCGGDEEGDDMVEEEDGSEFDVKPDIGELDELINKEEKYMEYLPEQYENMEEEDGGDNDVDDSLMISNVTDDDQLELPDNNQTRLASLITKIEVNEAVIRDDY